MHTETFKIGHDIIEMYEFQRIDVTVKFCKGIIGTFENHIAVYLIAYKHYLFSTLLLSAKIWIPNKTDWHHIFGYSGCWWVLSRHLKTKMSFSKTKNCSADSRKQHY